MGRLPAVFSLPALSLLPLWAALLLAWVAVPSPQAQTAPPQAQTAPPQAQTAPPQAQMAPPLPMKKIAGRLQGAPSGANLETARVILVQYTLDEENQIQEQKIEEVSPDKDGRFGFSPITELVKGMYRIFATLEDNRTSTRLFPLAKPGGIESFELQFPRLTEDRSALRIEEGSLLIEVRKKSVMVTELVRLLNPTQNTMEAMRNPLVLFLPKAAESLEMLSPPDEANRHQRMDNRLLVSMQLPPGRTSVAFRYSIPAASASLTLEKRYSLPIAKFLVLSPENGLTLQGQGFLREKERTIEKVRYRAWSRNRVEAGRKITLNLTGFPQLITDRSALRIQEVRIAFEPSSGGAMVTEVLHYINPTRDIMEGVKTPLEISIPEEAESLEMIFPANKPEGQKRVGSKLLVYVNLPPDRTTVAFRYRLAAGWGSLSLEKRYGRAVANLFVLSPEGRLKLRGEGFVSDEIQTYNDLRFESWVRKGIEAGQPVILTVSGLPIRQSVMLPWIGVFLAIMGGVVAWYWRKRISSEEKTASVTPAQG